ncbi:MAG: hypothetical protein ABR520_11280 [Mycobacteriales bacterium]|nr:hypothetical protein [Actinomycetota bacterium]
MTTTFSSLPADKIDSAGGSSPVAVNPKRKWSPNDANAVLQLLRQLSAYLASGTLDAATTHTIADLDVVSSASPSVGPEIDLAGNRGRWFLGIDVANAQTSRDLVLVGQRGTYSFGDGVTTSGSPTLTSASGGGFTSSLVGASIGGAGIPNGTTVSAVGGTTSLTLSANATATASSVAVTVTRGTASDLFYVKHRGALAPTFGIGVTPPDGTARLQVSPDDSEPAMGGIALRIGPSQTGKAWRVFTSDGTDRLWVDAGGYVSGLHSTGGALVVQATAATPGPTDARALVMTDNAKSNFYGFTFQGGNECTFRCISGGADSFKIGTNGLLTAQVALRGTGARAAAPSTGTHVAGEIVFNADPVASGKIGWVCVTGGTPGTWKAWGAIDA